VGATDTIGLGAPPPAPGEDMGADEPETEGLLKKASFELPLEELETMGEAKGAGVTIGSVRGGTRKGSVDESPEFFSGVVTGITLFPVSFFCSSSLSAGVGNAITTLAGGPFPAQPQKSRS